MHLITSKCCETSHQVRVQYALINSDRAHFHTFYGTLTELLIHKIVTSTCRCLVKSLLKLWSVSTIISKFETKLLKKLIPTRFC